MRSTKQLFNVHRSPMQLEPLQSDFTPTPFPRRERRSTRSMGPDDAQEITPGIVVQRYPAAASCRQPTLAKPLKAQPDDDNKHSGTDNQNQFGARDATPGTQQQPDQSEYDQRKNESSGGLRFVVLHQKSNSKFPLTMNEPSEQSVRLTEQSWQGRRPHAADARSASITTHVNQRSPDGLARRHSHRRNTDGIGSSSIRSAS